MLKLILILISSFVILTSCCDNSNNDDGSTDGLIIGADFRECVCCGGWFISIGNDTLRTWSTPDYFMTMIEGKVMPVKVSLKYKRNTEACGQNMSDLIDVHWIGLR